MKIALSAFDTKRCNNGIETLAFGHWRTDFSLKRTIPIPKEDEILYTSKN